MPIYRSHVLVCGGTPCVLKGARTLKDLLNKELTRYNLADEIRVVETGCLGPCDEGPVIIVYPEGTMYSRLQPSDIPRIVQSHLLKGRILQELVCQAPKAPPLTQAEVPLEQENIWIYKNG
ncbi:MAG: (2Fe-2S) ferredoxin domain-containing protein [Firmicutes bacterium]|nr:(2Fe-2S) ferredoxin domain-containing protein [Bacillota bacterium]